MWTLLVWIACAPDGTHSAAEPPAREPVALLSGAEPNIVTESFDGLGDDPAGWIFSRDIVHHVEITLDDENYQALDDNPFQYAKASITYDGLEVGDVGLRLRGAIGSFREIWDKPKFKIEFDWITPGREFYGLEELALNSSVADCTYLKEAAAYRVFEVAGIAVPRLAFTRVTLNGLDYGLYQVVETEDENWLKRNFADPSGNLYDGKYIWYGGWSYTLLDFSPSVHDQYILEEGIDVGHADVHAVSDAYAAGAYTPDFMTLTDPVVDWDHWHRFLAVEEFIGHNDGYALNQNNNRIWFDPADGKVEIYAWDLDNTFLWDWMWGMSWSNPRGYLSAGCWADPTCAADQADAVANLIEDMAAEDMESYLQELHDLTYDDAVTDPKLWWCNAAVLTGRQDLIDWFDEHPPTLVSHWGL